MPSEGVFIVVGKLLGGLGHGRTRGRRSMKVGAGIALRIGQNSALICRFGGRIVVMGLDRGHGMHHERVVVRGSEQGGDESDRDA